MRFPAMSLNHITIKVPDLHRTSKFYQDFLECPFGNNRRPRIS
jgi:catechol 2,3-dioxygenase-like lactoylglutathione lyase family enzyme